MRKIIIYPLVCHEARDKSAAIHQLNDNRIMKSALMTKIAWITD
ncbi:hypothetical protein yinte0001_8270 [Yersinia intermedia ATCC 29909]|nr:hypothetical protein yinte0001_8270 [Yersinia intermedia ATCC 29909]